MTFRNQVACGTHAVLGTFICEAAGLHRSADDTLDGYLLFRGVDADPDLEAAPWETFGALLHETAALDPDHEYRFVLRRRNRHGLASRNIRRWSVRLDAEGAAAAVPPSGPDHVLLEAASSGAMRLRAWYASGRDGQYAGSQWLVYLTSDGTDPDPDVDEPQVLAMAQSGPWAILDAEEGPYADEADVRVIVRVRRVDAGPVNVDSENTDVHQADAEMDGPTAPAPRAFFGEVRERVGDESM